MITLVSRKENQLKMKDDGAELNKDFLMRKREMDENMHFLIFTKVIGCMSFKGLPAYFNKIDLFWSIPGISVIKTRFEDVSILIVCHTAYFLNLTRKFCGPDNGWKICDWRPCIFNKACLFTCSTLTFPV